MNPSTPSILEVQDLGFAYPEQPALASGWSASIGAGVTLLYGDTGAGKSALLRVLAGDLAATAGTLTLTGLRLDRSPEAYRRQVFFCDLTTGQFDTVVARECGHLLGKDDPHFDARKWQALVEGFALTPHLDKQMHMLSTGSKRKIGLAAALASGRSLVLLDEPTVALDAASIRCLWRTLADFATEPGQRAVVVASAARIDAVPLRDTIELPLRQGR